MFNGENELDKVIKRSNQPSSSAKLIPYCTIDDEFEIMNTVGKNKIVHFEKPSKIYGFKVADIDLDKILILNREGFDDEEMAWIIEFTKNNKELINKNEVPYYA